MDIYTWESPGNSFWLLKCIKSSRKTTDRQKGPVYRSGRPRGLEEAGKGASGKVGENSAECGVSSRVSRKIMIKCKNGKQDED